MEKKFGLIGSTVSHSFSKAYFDEKFFNEGLRDYHYDLYPLKNVDELKTLLKENPEKKILHTVQVEKNGFIHSMLAGTARENQGYIYFGEPAYSRWIESE